MEGIAKRRSTSLLAALVLTCTLALAPARAQEPAPADPPADASAPADGSAPADAGAPADGAMPAGTDVPADGAATAEPATGDTTMPADGTGGEGSEPGSAAGSELTTDATSEPATEPATDAAADPMPLTTVTADVVRPVEGEFTAPPSEPTTGTRGQAATFRLKFEPSPGQSRRLTESNSEQMKLVLPPSIPDGPPEERSRLTTTTIVSTVGYEANPEGGWRQSEVVHQFQRYEEGLAVPDPLVKVLSGARLVTRLDANGMYQGVEDPQAFLAGLLSRAPEPERAVLSTALSAQAIDHESRMGWSRKLGRYLSIPLRIGHPSFLVENGELGELGRMPYILCAIPSTIEQVGAKQCVRVDLVSFAANLKDGVMSGIPDEVEAEFMAWTEGKDIAFSPPELSVYGAGEVLLELNGTGTVRYRNEETFHVSPATINRPMGGPIQADELTVKRVNTLTLE